MAIKYHYTCQACGKVEETDNVRAAAARKYCPECSKERHKQSTERCRSGGEGVTNTCLICGKTFPILKGMTTQRQFCDDCRAKRRHEKKEKPRPKSASLIATAMAAKAAGMSYGRYQGWLQEQARLAAKK